MSLDQDVKVKIAGKEYELVLDAMALSRFEEWLNLNSGNKFNIGWLEWWQHIINRANEQKHLTISFPIRDALNLLWCALQRHHSKKFRDVATVSTLIENPFEVTNGLICVALVECWQKHLPESDDTESPEPDDGEEKGNPLPENGGT